MLRRNFDIEDIPVTMNFLELGVVCTRPREWLIQLMGKCCATKPRCDYYANQWKWVQNIQNHCGSLLKEGSHSLWRFRKGCKLPRRSFRNQNQNQDYKSQNISNCNDSDECAKTELRYECVNSDNEVSDSNDQNKARHNLSIHLSLQSSDSMPNVDSDWLKKVLRFGG